MQDLPGRVAGDARIGESDHAGGHQHVARLGIVQVSDFRVGEALRLNRRVPGDGSMPLAWMIETLLEAGYPGLFDIELIGPSVDAEGPEAALRRSVDWLGERLTEYGA